MPMALKKTSCPPSFATLYSSWNEAATDWREAANSRHLKCSYASTHRIIPHYNDEIDDVNVRYK
jgi:hypothetical protein